MLSENRDAPQPPDASGYCEKEGRIHLLTCEPRRVHWHQPCLQDVVELRPSATARLADGFRMAMSNLAAILLKKILKQRLDEDYATLRDLRMWQLSCARAPRRGAPVGLEAPFAPPYLYE